MLLFPLDSICSGRPLLVQLVPLPRNPFNVKCLEMSGNAGKPFVFVVMLKIAQTKTHFNAY